MKKKEPPSFWITNISNRNVSLSDLNLTIRAFSSINALDKRHYEYTREQLEKSVISGSIYAKRDKIVVRKNAPENIVPMNIPLRHETYIPTRGKSTLEIKEEHYEELNISDEDYANENAELAEADRQIFKKV